MKDDVGCLICGCGYNGLRKAGDVCGDLSYATGPQIATALPCPGICIPLVGDRKIYYRAHLVISKIAGVRPNLSPT
jgi:hypothetical protein